MCLLKRNLTEAVDSAVGIFPHCCVIVAPSGDLTLAVSALLSGSHASVTYMTPCALHALVLTAQGALPDILGIPHMLLYLCQARLPGPGSHTLFTLSSPSRGSDSVHFDLDLPDLQENTVCGDWWWWKRTASRAEAGSAKTETRAQMLWEQEETLQNGCGSL